MEGVSQVIEGIEFHNVSKTRGRNNIRKVERFFLLLDYFNKKNRELELIGI